MPQLDAQAPGPSDRLTTELETNRRLLWGLCYRMTGSASDADDLVQETFTRAIERPPARPDLPWRPWLVTVAANLSRDHLRRRKRARYVGPWLPTPIETMDGDPDAADLTSPPAHEPSLGWTDDGQAVSTENRYDLMESVSYAFLVALEELTPNQRAVLLLRDVFDYSVEEAATALSLSVPNVKTTHHRARKAMAGYDGKRIAPMRERQALTLRTLERFLAGLASSDLGEIEATLRTDVRALSDGAGEFFAARKPLLGPARVMRFYSKIAQLRAAHMRSEIRWINGLPAVVATFHDGKPGQPTHMVMTIDVDTRGQIAALHSVVATQKLRAIRF